MEEETLYPDITKLSINEQSTQPQSTASPISIPISTPTSPATTPVTIPVITPTPVTPSAPESPAQVPVGKQEEFAKPATPFEQKLKQLEEMGFADRAKNIELLVKFNGDIVRVVKSLLDI